MYMSRIADNKDATSSTDVSMLFKMRKYACITRIGILISRILYCIVLHQISFLLVFVRRRYKCRPLSNDQSPSSTASTGGFPF